MTSDTIITLGNLGCTGYIDFNGYLLHDGDCPVHETETIAALALAHARGYVAGYSAAIHDARQPGSRAHAEIIAAGGLPAAAQDYIDPAALTQEQIDVLYDLAANSDDPVEAARLTLAATEGAPR
jgi:hypothetical protein